MIENVQCGKRQTDRQTDRRTKTDRMKENGSEREGQTGRQKDGTTGAWLAHTAEGLL